MVSEIGSLAHQNDPMRQRKLLLELPRETSSGWAGPDDEDGSKRGIVVVWDRHGWRVLEGWR
jgi:hypothetical protein